MSEDNERILNELVDSIRSKLQDPSQSELKKPLQITIIWLKSTKNDIQFLLFNHTERFNDKTFNILGPYKASKKGVLNDLGVDIYKTEVFKSLVDDGNLLKTDLKKIIKMNIPYLKRDRKNEVIKDDSINKEIYYLIYLGNLFDSPQTSIIQLFQDIEKEKIRFEQMFRTPETPFQKISKDVPDEIPDEIKESWKEQESYMKIYRMPFLAGYIRPPIWIGAPPYHTHPENFYTVPLSTYIKTVKYVEILGRRIILMNDGFLAISINTNLDGKFEYFEFEETYKVIDFFLSLLLISKLDGHFEIYSTQESEFILMDYIIAKKSFAENHTFKGHSRMMSEWRKEIPSRSQFQSVRTLMHPLHIELVLSRFKTFVKMEKMRRYLKLLIESYTHLLRMEADQSFIFSWVLVEQYLNHEWELYLEQKKISNKKKKNYTANMKINLLSQLGIFGEDDTRELSNLRKLRNDFIHKIRLIERKDAKKAFNLALRFVNKRMEDYHMKKFKEYLIQNKLNKEED